MKMRQKAKVLKRLGLPKEGPSKGHKKTNPYGQGDGSANQDGSGISEIDYRSRYYGVTGGGGGGVSGDPALTRVQVQPINDRGLPTGKKLYFDQETLLKLTGYDAKAVLSGQMISREVVSYNDKRKLLD